VHIDRDYDEIQKALNEILPSDRYRRLAWKPEALRAWRHKQGLTQLQLSEMTGILQPKISEAERGLASSKGRKRKSADGVERTPRMDATLLYALATALGCKLQDIAVVPFLENEVATITSEVIRQLQPQFLVVDQIHTLVHPNEKISLRSIYYRTALQDRSAEGASGSKRTESFVADTLHDLSAKACVILGTAGQGKSVFLRYLTIQEAIKEQSLPLFFELRRLPERPLVEVIQSRMQHWGLCESRQQLKELLREGHISLLFDAIDELAAARRGEFLTELADLHEANPTMRIVVTSRPDSGILACDWLHPYSIAPLNLNDVRALVRIYASPEEAEQITAQLDTANRMLVNLLTAPIFAALLVIKYQYSHTIPHDLTAYYRDLFDALVRRHNTAEAGPRREIRSELLPFDLESAFQAICFAVHAQFGDRPPHIRQVQELSVKISEALQLKPRSPSLIVHDVIDITSLIVEEAGYCFFIHKSVREYYAAAHIARLPDPVAQAFYQRMAGGWRSWEYVLQFLEQLDPVRMAVCFELTELETILKTGALSFLMQFQSISILKVDQIQEQLYIGTGSFYSTRHLKIVVGGLRPDFVQQGFTHWCPGQPYPQLQPGERVRIDRTKIDYAKLLEWLGDNVATRYATCQKRLNHCRRLATAKAVIQNQ